MDNTCMACPEKENQEHLVECGVIRDEFWDPILKLLTDMGMEVPHNVGNFLIAGHMRRRKVISNNYSGIVFLAWRCLYAQRSNTQEKKGHKTISSMDHRSFLMDTWRLASIYCKNPCDVNVGCMMYSTILRLQVRSKYGQQMHINSRAGP